MYYLCFELGGTNLRYGVVSDSFEIVDFRKIPTAGLAEAEDKISYFSSIINAIFQDHPSSECRCISMALSSLMDAKREYVYSSPMVKGFDDIPLKASLEKKFNIPVVLEKDVNILLLYELSKLGLDSSGITCGFFLGTGIGNAISIDGRVYSGHTGSACELGHIPVAELKEYCKCGKQGCIELKACGHILETIAEKKGCNIKDIFKLYSEDKEIKNFIYYLALAISTEVCILDPHNIILGGGLIEMPGFPMNLLEENVLQNLRYPNPRDSVVFHYATGDSEAGVVGAALHVANLGFR